MGAPTEDGSFVPCPDKGAAAAPQAAAASGLDLRRFELALQATNDGFWEWDPATNLLYRSARCWAMIGYGENELEPAPELCRWLMHPEDWERANRVVGEALKSRDSFSLETRLRHKAGHYVPIGTRGVIVRDAEGTAVRVAGANTDLTEQKRAEAQLLQAGQQGQRMQKTKSLHRMAGAMAHCFNNQLQAVMLNLEIARSHLPEEGEPATRLLDAIQSARKAADVSTLMLTYLGQVEAKQELQDLSAVCTKGLALWRATMPPSVVLELDLPSPGPVVRANAVQLHQVLANLMTNAWEVCDAHRCVIRLAVKTVAAADIPATHRFPFDFEPQEAAYACLGVADQGRGIRQEDFEELFEPFFSTKSVGRGLGLAVVLGIVRSHGGVVTVRNHLNRGCTFEVFLPVATGVVVPGPVDVSKAPVATKPLPGTTVLVVEDDVFLRDTLALALKYADYQVLTAEDGIAAVELFRRHQQEIGCVVCDLIMPRMNGWDTLLALRRMAPGLPVILASGYDEGHVMREDHPERPQAFLHKPFEVAALIKVLKQVLAQRSAPQQG